MPAGSGSDCILFNFYNYFSRIINIYNYFSPDLINFHLYLKKYNSHKMPLNKRISHNILKNKRFLQEITVFHGRETPEKAALAGYGAMIDALNLPVPLPARLALISKKRRQYQTPEWIILTPRHSPEDSLYGHLVFAIKYEGINLLFFRKLFGAVEPSLIQELVKNEPLSQYSRRIWFLYEWLMLEKLNVKDLEKGNYVPMLNPDLQYALNGGINSSRHRIRNNLPGSLNFCPLIFRSPVLDDYIKKDLAVKTAGMIEKIHKDILLRTSAFLLLSDSRASFNIEGETPDPSRANRWGKAIGQAGSHALSKNELLRLQQTVIESDRFINMGFRTEGGFIGEHDRNTGEPVPDHISARWQDIDLLINGLLETNDLLEKNKFHPVLAAACVAFGFVFIHPFVDGNGRIHRYLIHHLLARMNFTPQGIIFPVSSAILERIADYRKVLESYSQPVLELIEWKKTENNNIEVLNDTVDYYRYFDATPFAEFIFMCIEQTIDHIIPEEVIYLKNYDAMKSWLDDRFEMPDKTVALLIRFLEQNNGMLSKRAREKEFRELTENEVLSIEKKFKECFDEI